MRAILALLLSLLLAPAWAQVPMTGAGKGTPAAVYQGPGDVVSGALAWGSCARVYNNSLASTSTSLCDLVDTSAGTTAICTLRGSASGFVDLTGTYCTGSTTPAAACAAASGGACRVSKVYDQIGGTSGWVNATNSQRPVLTFSAANGLPGLTATSAANTSLTTSSTFTQALPFTWVTVGKRTANFTTAQALIGASGSYNGIIGFTSSADTVGISGNAVTYISVGSQADSNFHAAQGVMDSSTNCLISVDGLENTGSCVGAALSSNTSRIMRFAGGNSLDGVWLEGGLWGGGFDAGQRSSMNGNAHGTNGYNF